MRKNSDELVQFWSQRNNRVDPEERFEEALALYDRAIVVNSKKATYHCNKNATLISLGRFLQAIVECEEAIRLEPSCGRPHNRLATIYFRLGKAEKALNCNETSPCVDSILAFQAQALQNHLSRCTKARKVKDWKVILKESQATISLGVDSAPLVYCLHTEALLKLLRHQETHATYEKMPKFDLDYSNKLFGPVRSAYLLMIGTHIYLAADMFEDAVTTSQQASKLDPSSSEVNAVVRRARAVASAKMSGNLLFKASKFTEAYVVYNEGL
ncbi:Inactive TPR repeat-containing thioredoxin TTL3 [Glycine soja]|uniref:Inactive TPR repeat-containing thioredoxin TTL3 n=1 Tax=Glycine soja TaxID=3848 RepID=A0A0B2RV63_GLYSO|nr:Inactive TPR repeat-containing thioredoxin TTL3 [Glycine soja]